MIFILAFIIFQLLITDIIKDSISVGTFYEIYPLLTGVVATTLYLDRSLSKEWLFLMFGGSIAQILLLFNGSYVPLILLIFIIVNSKQLLKPNTQRWRTKEGETIT